MKAYLLIILSLSFGQYSYSQCNNSFQFPSSDVQASTFDNPVVVTHYNYAGDYYKVENMVVGETYVFTSSVDSDYITIRGYNSVDLVAHGTSPLSYTVVGADKYSIHINTSASCGSQNVNRSSYITCNSCPELPGMIGVNSTQPESILDVAGEVRIGSTGIDAKAGMIRWNEGSGDFEGYNGSEWVSLTQREANGTWGSEVPCLIKAHENQLIENPSFSGEQSLGVSVAIAQDWAIIGAPNDMSGEGSVYMYKLENGTWVEKQKIVNIFGNSGEHFGYDVDIDGDYAIISSPWEAVAGIISKGSVRVFKREADNWVLDSWIYENTSAGGTIFGKSIALSNDRLVTTDYDDVHVYLRNGNTWNLEATLSFQDTQGSSAIKGYNVDIDDDTIIVGDAYESSNDITWSGAVYIFEYNGVSWLQEARFDRGNSVDPNLHYGWSVTISGDIAAVGSHEDYFNSSNVDPGTVYTLFKDSSANWGTGDNLFPAEENDIRDRFGASLSLSGNVLVVGAYGSVLDGGKAFIFEKNNETGMWYEVNVLSGSDTSSGILVDGPEFGFAVAVDNHNIIVGSPMISSEDPLISQGEGKVYIFKKN